MSMGDRSRSTRHVLVRIAVVGAEAEDAAVMVAAVAATGAVAVVVAAVATAAEVAVVVVAVVGEVAAAGVVVATRAVTNTSFR